MKKELWQFKNLLNGNTHRCVFILHLIVNISLLNMRWFFRWMKAIHTVCVWVQIFPTASKNWREITFVPFVFRLHHFVLFFLLWLHCTTTLLPTCAHIVYFNIFMYLSQIIGIEAQKHLNNMQTRKAENPKMVVAGFNDK